MALWGPVTIGLEALWSSVVVSFGRCQSFQLLGIPP